MKYFGGDGCSIVINYNKKQVCNMRKKVQALTQGAKVVGDHYVILKMRNITVSSPDSKQVENFLK